MSEEEYLKEYNKLWEISQKLRPYYDIDKVKSWGVFVCSKVDAGFGEDVFDILKDKIIFYNKEKAISEEAKSIIKEIQDQLKLMNKEE